MTPNPNRLITSYEASQLLQMDPTSVVKWVNDGILPAFRTPGGHRRIRAADLLAFMKQHNMFIPPELTGVQTRLLVVDDDPGFLKALTRSMKAHERVELTTCSGGIEALIHIGAQPPDVLVIDVQMPGVDGLDVLKTLRAMPATRNVEIVVVTGHPTPALEAKVRTLGAKALLAKPITAAALMAVLGASSAG